MMRVALPLEGVANARQLGGYAVQGGQRVKQDVLLRSGMLLRATRADIETLTQHYHLRTIIDLRTLQESRQEPNPVLPGVRSISIPVLDPDSLNQTAVVQIYKNAGNDIGKTMVELVRAGVLCDELYTAFLDSEASMQAFRRFFDVLLEHEQGAVLWHCTGGKDRTGLAAVMLLSLLGADRETVLADFALTNTFNRERIDYVCAQARRYTDDPRELQQAALLAGVSVEHMERVLDRAEARCGTMQAYLQKRLGISEAEIKALRQKYLENDGRERLL